MKKSILSFIDYFIRKNKVIIEGNRTQVIGNFNDYMIESYSNRFNAIWFYIIENIKDNFGLYRQDFNEAAMQAKLQAILKTP